MMQILESVRTEQFLKKKKKDLNENAPKAIEIYFDLRLLYQNLKSWTRLLLLRFKISHRTVSKKYTLMNETFEKLLKECFGTIKQISINLPG